MHEPKNKEDLGGETPLDEAEKARKLRLEIVKNLRAETKNILIDKLLKTYELKSHEIAEAVELYYDAQKLRIMHGNKISSEKTDELPSEIAMWFAHWLDLGEGLIKSKLQVWVEGPESPPVAKWSYAQVGIGPVIAAGLAAHIDLSRARHASSVWKFAGLAPGADRRVKGKKLPYNSRLKTLAWKLGESFVKASNKEGAVYGQWYAKYKAEELARNAQGLYAAQAARELATKKIKEKKIKEILESGHLTDGHLHARAKRKAVKLFLSDYWVFGRKSLGLPVTEPYAIAILKHSGKIDNLAAGKE
jgi:hypothetical protein